MKTASLLTSGFGDAARCSGQQSRRCRKVRTVRLVQDQNHGVTVRLARARPRICPPSRPPLAVTRSVMLIEQAQDHVVSRGLLRAPRRRRRSSTCRAMFSLIVPSGYPLRQVVCLPSVSSYWSVHCAIGRILPPHDARRRSGRASMVFYGTQSPITPTACPGCRKAVARRLACCSPGGTTVTLSNSVGSRRGGQASSSGRIPAARTDAPAFMALLEHWPRSSRPGQRRDPSGSSLRSSPHDVAAKHQHRAEGQRNRTGNRRKVAGLSR
jgi:hypothetical protein